MGYDLVTWLPSISGGGAGTDDDYNLSGGTKLDGTLDTGIQTPILIGDGSGFSTTPTIVQLNASSHLNQIIGLIRRRMLRYNTLFGTALGAPSLLTSNKRIKAAAITTLQTSINSLRVAEGFASYSFSNTPTTGKGALASHVAELRKALRCSGTMNVVTGAGGTKWGLYQFTDDTFPGTHHTPADELNSTSNTGDVLAAIHTDTGKLFVPGASGPNSRRRRYYQFPVPDWLTSASSASFLFTISVSTTTMEGFTGRVYSSNTDISAQTMTPAYSGFAWNTDNLEGTFASTVAGAGQQTTALTLSHVTGVAGGRFCTILTTDHERDGTGLNGSGGSQLASTFRHLYTDHILQIDLGA